jgi:hypothetical protein
VEKTLSLAHELFVSNLSLANYSLVGYFVSTDRAKTVLLNDTYFLVRAWLFLRGVLKFGFLTILGGYHHLNWATIIIMICGKEGMVIRSTSNSSPVITYKSMAVIKTRTWPWTGGNQTETSSQGYCHGVVAWVISVAANQPQATPSLFKTSLLLLSLLVQYLYNV